jgi:hypothetical protein
MLYLGLPSKRTRVIRFYRHWPLNNSWSYVLGLVCLEFFLIMFILTLADGLCCASFDISCRMLVLVFNPCGGRFEYLNRSPASRRRRRKGNPVPGGITRPPCSWGIWTRDLALQVGGVPNLRQKNMVISPAGLGPENDCAGENQHKL